jgi:hypothetical protein
MVKLFLELCYGFRIAFSNELGLYRGFSKMEAFGYALGHAGRLQALVDPIHAVIAFDRFSRFGIPLGCAPGAGCNAAFAAYAEVFLHKDDPILRPFLHGTRGACGDTPGVLAVKAGHKDIGHPGKVVDQLGSHRDNLTKARAQRQAVLGFTVGLAAKTSDAAFDILVNIVLAHEPHFPCWAMIRLALP